MSGIGISISPMLRRFRVASASSTLLTGLSASWSLNSNPNDNLGLNNGVATNVTYAAGQFSSAAVFDGTAYISVADSSIFTVGNSDFAYSIWVKRNVSGTREIFTGQSNSIGADNSISFWIEFRATNEIRVLFNKNTFMTTLDSISNISDTNWHNIIIQRNGGTLEMYIDGVLDNSVSGLGTDSLNNSATVFGIGNAGDLTILRLNGMIDEVNLWNGRKLTTGEITELQTKAYPF